MKHVHCAPSLLLFAIVALGSTPAVQAAIPVDAQGSHPTALNQITDPRLKEFGIYADMIGKSWKRSSTRDELQVDTFTTYEWDSESGRIVASWQDEHGSSGKYFIQPTEPFEWIGTVHPERYLRVVDEAGSVLRTGAITSNGGVEWIGTVDGQLYLLYEGLKSGGRIYSSGGARRKTFPDGREGWARGSVPGVERDLIEIEPEQAQIALASAEQTMAARKKQLEVERATLRQWADLAQLDKSWWVYEVKSPSPLDERYPTWQNFKWFAWQGGSPGDPSASLYIATHDGLGKMYEQKLRLELKGRRPTGAIIVENALGGVKEVIAASTFTIRPSGQTLQLRVSRVPISAERISSKSVDTQVKLWSARLEAIHAQWEAEAREDRLAEEQRKEEARERARAWAEHQRRYEQYLAESIYMTGAALASLPTTAGSAGSSGSGQSQTMRSSVPRRDITSETREWGANYTGGGQGLTVVEDRTPVPEPVPAVPARTAAPPPPVAALPVVQTPSKKDCQSSNLWSNCPAVRK